MTVIGAAEVERAHRQGAAVRVGPGDLITPLARERAADLGVRIARDGEAPGAAGRIAPRPSEGGARPAPVVTRPAPVVGDGPRVLAPGEVNALYRRSAPTGGALRAVDEVTRGRRGRPRVAVIGAGHVGSIAALRLAESDLFAEVVIVDVVDGLAAGIALDLWHSAGPAHFGTTIRGSAELSEIAGVDYVIMTAGRARKPGMTRTDLTTANAGIVGPVADRVADLAPASVLIMVTNPLEEMTQLARLRTGFHPERVLGMAGMLDSARFCSLVALTGICRADQVQALALGSHGPEMVLPLSQASVDGTPLRSLLTAATLQEITVRTRDSGAEVVGLLKTGSAYFAPGQCAARMAIVMASGSDEVLACAVEPTGQYGLRDTRVGLPVRLGPGGLREVVQLSLEPDELAALRAAADRLGERIREVADHAGGDLLRAR
jgi:malate dehydrogenase